MKPLHQRGCLCFYQWALLPGPARTALVPPSKPPSYVASQAGSLERSPLTAHPSLDTIRGTRQGPRAPSQTLMYLWNYGCAKGNRGC